MTSRTITTVIHCYSIEYLFVAETSAVEHKTINPEVLSGGIPCLCVASEDREAAIVRPAWEWSQLVVKVRECGDGLCHPVASLDVTDPQQQCPIGWSEYNENSVRACRWPVTDLGSGSCPATFYATSCQYRGVRGRAIGYLIGSPDAFGNQAA